MEEKAARPARAVLLEYLAAEVDALASDPFVRVAIDGVDGAGKSTFASELAAALRAVGRTVVHASVDGFHRPRARRHARGRHDPRGFYEDSYDLASLARELLDPFAPGGHGLHRTQVFDVRTDCPRVGELEQAPVGTVLIVDGIFLHRPELRRRWSWSLWLEVDRGISLQRCAARDGVGTADPGAASNRRYVEGQRLYMAQALPQRVATHVIDNDDLDAPVLLR